MGTVGTIVLSTLSVILGALYLWQLYKAKNYEVLRKNYDVLQTALNASETERKIHEDASKRKSVELAEANQTLGELKAKTDLSAVLTMLSETITLTRESVELSRKADRENAQANLQLAKLIENHGEHDRQVFMSIDSSLKHTAEMLEGLTGAIRSHRQDARSMIDGVHKDLKAIESRVNRKPHERTRQND